MKRLFWLLIFVPLASFADDVRDRDASPTSVIEDSICVPDISGQTCLHVDEDVPNLVIEVLGEDGTQVALYDTGTELEDIASIGTYAAPSANNVRVSPQGGASPVGPDLTQIMLADAVYAGEARISICITDGGVTIMDFCRTVEMGAIIASLATIDANVDSVLADTGTDGVVLAAGSVNTTSIATNAIGSDELGSDAVDEIWNEIIEDTGSTYTARCAQAIALAYAAGTWSTAGAVSTFRDPGDNENRIVGTIGATSRTGITITCP
jgi:hypothetical protein